MDIPTNIQYAASTAVCMKAGRIIAEPLIEADWQEAIEFLSRRPVDTVILSGWLHDHGIVSPQHRGTFFGCRDSRGELVGVAMIGQNLLFEASTDEAIEAVANRARECPNIHMVFAEEEKLRKFWNWYRPDSVMPEPTRHLMVSSGTLSFDEIETVSELRVANLEELEPIILTHAEMVFAETGIDPLLADPDGFRKRCAERVEMGRVWVCFKDSELIFKMDIIAETKDAIYSEGLWVHPKERGRGYATRCLASLCRQISTPSTRLCGFVDAEQSLSDSLYRKAGFMVVAEYAKIYI